MLDVMLEIFMTHNTAVLVFLLFIKELYSEPRKWTNLGYFYHNKSC